jgi:membrane protease YdiL (CAAX protease family)
MTKSFPALSILFFGLIGPIVEEITYRVGLFGLAKRVNRVFAYIIVPIVFGFIHFDFESIGTDRFLNEIFNMPTYILGGLALAFLYDRFGFAASTTTHILNNLWATIASLIPSGK